MSAAHVPRMTESMAQNVQRSYQQKIVAVQQACGTLNSSRGVLRMSRPPRISDPAADPTPPAEPNTPGGPS